MTEVSKHIKKIWELPEEERKIMVDTVLKIMENVLNNPNDPKYRDMNFSKIRLKFKPCPEALFLLFSGGFNQNFDGSRLQFELQNWKMLEHAHSVLMMKINAEKGIFPSDKDNDNNNNNNANNVNNVEKEQSNENNNNNNNNNSDELQSEFQSQESNPIIPKEDETVLKDMGLDADELSLLHQIRSNKDTTVTLSMAELQGLSKEEKIAIFKQKQEQYRVEKAQAQTKNSINKEKLRREGLKAAQEAQEKREEYQRKMLAQRKNREKDDDRLRKKRIQEKIAEDKERKKKEKEYAQKLAEQKKQQQTPPS